MINKVQNLIKIIFFIDCLIFSSIFSQGIKINEISSSNTNVIEDEDGDFPDWFELFNNSNQSINISTYFVTDDSSNLAKWQFPNIEIAPDSIQIIFASGKDRTRTVQYWETIVRQGDECKYLIPQSNPTNEWKYVNYNDASWATGYTSIGYGDNDDNTVIPPTITVYIRCRFNVEDVNQISGLFFNADFDDGFVAYLNGEEIARENLGDVGSLVYYNTLATRDREAQMYQGYSPNSYPINDKISLLTTGENILSIEVHNVSSTSSDLTIIPFLSLGYVTEPTNSRGSLDLLNLPVSQPHTNFKLNANGELLIVSDQNGNIVDSLFTRNQIPNISVGRYPNGSENIFYFNNPTPGTENIDDGFLEFLNPPVFAKARGLYSNPISVDISNPNTTGSIRYSINGSEPTINSTLYTGAISISNSTVLRAKIFFEGKLPSKTETYSYFINTIQRLPIVSISTNPDNFFDYNTGIYVMGPNAETAFPYFGANFWQDWERPVHIELFEENNQFGFEMDCGVKIFGQWSRANTQKSIAFFARGSYGYSKINYKLFPNQEIEEYQNFVLRNSGNDWNNTMLRDAVMQKIVSPLDIDIQNYRPAVVYLNGEYWGLQNIREKVNEHYIEDHYGIQSDDVNLLENNADIVHGNKGNYTEIYNSLSQMNMGTDEAFNYINSNIDIKEFIDYFLSEIFFDNRDWPGNNIKFWQQRSTNSKWRWILYDTDYGFGIWDPNAYQFNTLEFALQSNGPDWPNPPWSTYLLRKFLENENFKNMFISRFSIYSNTIFTPESINEIISDYSSKIQTEILFHFQRWGGSYSNWLSNIAALRNFANNRSINVTNHFISKFNISGQYRLTINQNTEKGKVEINDVEVHGNSWHGNFFNNIPLVLKAIPRANFKFSNWEGDITSNENPIEVSSINNISITPVFISQVNTNIVINEINYNSSDTFNPEDWIELYNLSDESVDLSGWIFQDEDPTPYFTIPDNTIIDGDGYVILCRDTILFKSKFPDVTHYYGNYGFGLSGGGELIRLYDNSGALIDSLTYDDKDPWPPECDGHGPTLELKNPTLDNSKYYYWKPSAGNGTPGKENDVYTAIDDKPELLPNDYKLSQNYPNPFNPSTTIKYQIPNSDKVKIEIYNLLGEKIETLVNRYLVAGTYLVKVNAENLSSGIYFYKIKSGNFSKTKKMVLLR